MNYLTIKLHSFAAFLSLMLVSPLSITGPVVSKKQDEKTEALVLARVEVYTPPPVSDPKRLSVLIPDNQGTVTPPLSDPEQPDSTLSPISEELLQTVEHLPLYCKTENQDTTDQTNTPQLTYRQKRNSYLKNIAGYTCIAGLMAPLAVVFLTGEAPFSTGVRVVFTAPYIVAGVPSAAYAAFNCYKLSRLCCGKEDHQ